MAFDAASETQYPCFDDGVPPHAQMLSALQVRFLNCLESNLLRISNDTSQHEVSTISVAAGDEEGRLLPLRKRDVARLVVATAEWLVIFKRASMNQPAAPLEGYTTDDNVPPRVVVGEAAYGTESRRMGGPATQRTMPLRSANFITNPLAAFPHVPTALSRASVKARLLSAAAGSPCFSQLAAMRPLGVHQFLERLYNDQKRLQHAALSGGEPLASNRSRRSDDEPLVLDIDGEASLPIASPFEKLHSTWRNEDEGAAGNKGRDYYHSPSPSPQHCDVPRQQSVIDLNDGDVLNHHIEPHVFCQVAAEVFPLVGRRVDDGGAHRGNRTDDDDDLRRRQRASWTAMMESYYVVMWYAEVTWRLRQQQQGNTAHGRRRVVGVDLSAPLSITNPRQFEDNAKRLVTLGLIREFITMLKEALNLHEAEVDGHHNLPRSLSMLDGYDEEIAQSSDGRRQRCNNATAAPLPKHAYDNTHRGPLSRVGILSGIATVHPMTPTTVAAVRGDDRLPKMDAAPEAPVSRTAVATNARQSRPKHNRESTAEPPAAGPRGPAPGRRGRGGLRTARRKRRRRDEDTIYASDDQSLSSFDEYGEEPYESSPSSESYAPSGADDEETPDCMSSDSEASSRRRAKRRHQASRRSLSLAHLGESGNSSRNTYRTFRIEIAAPTCTLFEGVVLRRQPQDAPISHLEESLIAPTDGIDHSALTGCLTWHWTGPPCK